MAKEEIAKIAEGNKPQPAYIVTAGGHYLALLCAQQKSDTESIIDRMADWLSENVSGMRIREWYMVRMSDTGLVVQSYIVALNPCGNTGVAALYSENGQLLRRFNVNKQETK